MQDLLHGDPAVSPIAVASSLKAAIPEDTSKKKDPGEWTIKDGEAPGIIL